MNNSGVIMISFVLWWMENLSVSVLRLIECASYCGFNLCYLLCRLRAFVNKEKKNQSLPLFLKLIYGTPYYIHGLVHLPKLCLYLLFF